MRVREGLVSRGRGRLTSGLVMLAAGALLLSGCAATPARADSESARQAESFPGVYAQTIEWEPCDDGYGLENEQVAKLESRGADISAFQCAMVEAPLDWTKPEVHETIELALMRDRATGDDRLGSLLLNPGGPGQSGLELGFGLGTQPGIDEVREHYDLVGFDPRGIGHSSPLECEVVPASLAVQLAYCAESDPLANSMGTVQVARDMDLLRTLLGDDKMHYLGYSYGTMLGGTYSTLFPERIGRMVLDSASSANWASLADSFDQSRAIAESMLSMLAECGGEYAVTACPAQTEEGLLEMLGQLGEAPLTTSDGTQIAPGTVFGYLITALYQPASGRELVMQNVGDALAGDQESIDQIAKSMSGGGASVNLAGTVVKCHAFPNDPDLVATIEHIEEVGVPKLLGGPELTPELIEQFVNLSCYGLGSSGDENLANFSGSPDAPILVFGITGDHATPYEGAVRLTEELGNARLVTLEGTGHGASFAKRSSCADGIATAYLVRGELPPEGTVCTDD